MDKFQYAIVKLCLGLSKTTRNPTLTRLLEEIYVQNIIIMMASGKLFCIYKTLNLCGRGPNILKRKHIELEC